MNVLAFLTSQQANCHRREADSLCYILSVQISKFIFIFQTSSSASLNNEDTDAENNEFKIQIFKMAGKNHQVLNTRSYRFIHFRKVDCPWHLSSLLFILLELWSSLLF